MSIKVACCTIVATLLAICWIEWNSKDIITIGDSPDVVIIRNSHMMLNHGISESDLTASIEAFRKLGGISAE